ncbi:MAG TPA: ABC transporter ATP-binding protein [Candidatus Saccharimonadales bacterium]|nr:ABC transporter ATP-binding protein [Candidatus Saccharimonadales bacterium]
MSTGHAEASSQCAAVTLPPPRDVGRNRVVISHACVRFGNLEVLDDVNLTVGESEIVSILGPSGCGKTTLLRSAGGLSPLSSGTVSIDGEVVRGSLPGVCMVFQHFGLFPWRNLWNNIAYGLKLRHFPKAEIERRVSEAIQLVGLKGFERAYPHQLSGGMQQRAGLARALVMQPRLLLMDEPFSAIDAQTREVLQFELLRIWDARPTAMLFVTHAIDEAVLLGDRVVVLAGRPSHVKAIFEVDLPRPRDRTITGSDAFAHLRNRVWTALFEGSGGTP